MTSRDRPPGTVAAGTAEDEIVAVRLRGLTVDVAGKRLLENASADFLAGKVTLVIGASGAGKTVLMKLLAGLPAEEDVVRAEGRIEVAGREVRPGVPGGTAVGLVFQNFALFDEMTSADNIKFARDHAPGGRRGLEPQELLAEFGIPPRVPVRALSGGQQQRLAIARTLAYDPEVLIYDEPTSGLDPANALRVADRIRRTAETHGKTTIVVTHDYEHLGHIADAVYLLDPVGKKLLPLEREALARLKEGLPGGGAFEEAPSRPRPSEKRLLSKVLAFFAATGAALEAALRTPFHLLPLWRSPRWGLRYFSHYVRLLASPGSFVYFATAGIIAGFVATHFSFKFLPHRAYAEPLIRDELLNGLGFVLYRVVVPVLVTVLLAARCGAATASDVGNRSYGLSLDAMRSFGVRPERYLLTNILYAFLAATPILIATGFLAARFTSLVVFVFDHPAEGAEYWDRHFHRDLRVPGSLFYYGTGWLLAKVLLCGIGVGSIAYHIGARPKLSGVEVSKGITATIIWATLYVLLVHFAFAFFEF